MKHHESEKTVYVAGHTGMVGSAICRRLVEDNYTVALPRTRIDLCDQKATNGLLKELKPHWVFLAAAKVGGIYANKRYPADFIYSNIMIQTNVIHAAYLTGVEKLLFLGSSCIYPKLAPQPIKEQYLLSGYLESTNEPYAVAKIAGVKMVQAYNRQYRTNFISVMPTNLYGPNDNFDLDKSHVVPALLRKTHEAKVAREDFVEVWGTGNPKRDFLYVEDLADACLFLMKHYSGDEPINIGKREEISIRELALLIKKIVGFQGELRFKPEMPDGTPRKVVDISRITSLGWEASTSLFDGLTRTYQWYLKNERDIRKR